MKMVITVSPRGGGGGGGEGDTLFFSSYVGSGPISTIHPKKLSGISSIPNFFFLILATPKNIPHSVP